MTKTNNVKRHSKESLTISYIYLRRLIGILGMALPLVVLLGGLIFAKTGLKPSISAYYYSNMRDVFVGILVGVAMFLVTYKGYDKRDHILTNITGFAGLGVAIFPTNKAFESELLVGVFQLPSKISNIFHSASALLFFLMLAVISIWIFTLTDGSKPITSQKKSRNFIYRLCGFTIIGAVVLLVFNVLFVSVEAMESYKIVFILETIMLEAFGISWLVKGETILKDPS